MGRKGQHFSSPPVYRYTPGIVERGETMTVGRRSFIIPDADPMPLGKRSMTVGRKVYSWSTAPDTTKMHGGFVSDRLADDDNGSAPMPAMLEDGTMGWVESLDNGVSWQVVRTVDMGDDPLPKIASGPPAREPKPLRLPKQSSTPRKPKSEKPLSRRQEQDNAVQQYLTGKGLTVVKITPAIRAAALDAIAAQKQLADYVGAA